jgi:hypothetical protein
VSVTHRMVGFAACLITAFMLGRFSVARLWLDLLAVFIYALITFSYAITEWRKLKDLGREIEQERERARRTLELIRRNQR